MKPYPLGIDNPYRIMQEMSSTNWSIYQRDSFQRIATFKSEFDAYAARRVLLQIDGYNV